MSKDLEFIWETKVINTWNSSVRKWLFKCKCWNEKYLNLSKVKCWRIKTCWCEKWIVLKIWDKFNRLKYLWWKESIWKKNFWLFLCDCWVTVKRRLTFVKRWQLKSCWCLTHDWSHWMSQTPFYKTWAHIVNRWNDNKFKNYENINISKEWIDFENFYKDMYDSYNIHLEKYWRHNTTIDRIDSKKDYCKENCRRATRLQQNRNTNRNVMYKWKCISQWAKELWISKNTINVRRKRGWDIEKAIFTQPIIWSLAS